MNSNIKIVAVLFILIGSIASCSVGGEICESFAWDNGITDRCLD